MAKHGLPVELLSILSAALYEAAKRNSSDVMELLLNCGSQFERESLSNAFDVACESGHRRAVRCLMKNDTENLFGLQECNKGFETAAMHGHSELVSYFMEHCSGRSYFTISEEAITTAAGNGYADIVRLLVQELRSSESRHNVLNRALNIASCNGHTEVVELLIREGSDVNAVVEEVSIQRDEEYMCFHPSTYETLGRHSNALQAALRGFSSGSSQYAYYVVDRDWRKADAIAQEATIDLLLKSGADVNELGGCPSYPLYTAAAHCSDTVVQSIIDKGAVLDESTSEYETALKAAAGRELRAATIVKLLLQAGAVIPASEAGTNPVLNSALALFGAESGISRVIVWNSVHDALNDGPGAVVKILLPRLPMEKADDERYHVLLQMAVVVGDRECVELLLERQVDVNAVGYPYGSALQAAAFVGNVELVQLLLGAGADINVLHGEHSTALRVAVLEAHEDIVRILINYGADVNLRIQDEDEQHENSKSILHLSLETGNVTIFSALIAAGADVNVDLLNHPPVLTAACGSTNITIVKLLLESGADVNATGMKGWRANIQDDEASALHMTSLRDHEYVAPVLLEHGAEMEMEVETFGTPLQVAADVGHVSLVQILLEAGAKVDHTNSYGTALSIASGHGHLEVVQKLLSAGATIFDPPRVPNALAAACQWRDRLVIEILLDELSGTEKKASACADAVFSADDEDTFQLLFEHGLSGSPLVLNQACAAGLDRSVWMLLEAGVDADCDNGEGGHALHTAACHQRSGVVKLLLDHGVDVNFQSAKSGSPLLATLEGFAAPQLRDWSLPRDEYDFMRWMPEAVLWGRSLPEPARSPAKPLPFPDLFDPVCFPRATSSGPGYKRFIECAEIVRTLVDHGANVNTEPRSFGNALHLASFMGTEPIVRLLLDQGADINATGGYFETPLLAALIGDHLAILELLLSRGINVNHFSSEHGTALHYACSKRSKATVWTLLKHGADVNAIVGQHGSALDAATSSVSSPLNPQEKCGIIELLLNCGLKIRECDLVPAAAERFDRGSYLKLLLEHDKTLQVTEPVLIAALTNDTYGYIVSRIYSSYLSVTEDLVRRKRCSRLQAHQRLCGRC